MKPESETTNLPKSPNWKNFPCGGDEEVQRLMASVRECPACRSTNITAGSDLQTPPTIAVICEDCGTAQDNEAYTLEFAVASWNLRAMTREERVAEGHAKVDAWKPVILIAAVLFAYLSAKMGWLK